MRPPADFMDAAKALIEEGTSNLTPAGIALVDQAEATTRETSKALRDLSKDAPGYHFATVTHSRDDSEQQSVAWRLAVLQAGAERATFTCAHCPLPAGSRLFISLTLRLIACARCYSTAAIAISQTTEPDNDCEVCGKPSDEFIPFICAAGFFTVDGNQCPACHAYSIGEAS